MTPRSRPAAEHFVKLAAQRQARAAQSPVGGEPLAAPPPADSGVSCRAARSGAQRRLPRWAQRLVAVGALAWATTLGALLPHATQGASLPEVIREAQRKVVKVYGAGGVRGLEAYQTGVLISADGEVLTSLSYVLDTDDLAIVLDDGRKFAAELLGTDPVCELALLRIPLDDDATPHFDLSDAAAARPGDRVLALSNLFGIAAGNEPVSALHGVVAAIAPLEARRGAFQANYRGPVVIVDAQANNPGAAGGALTTWEGRLLGILGKELQSDVTGAWLHYALPVEAFADSIAELRRGGALRRAADAIPPDEPLTLADMGLALVPDVLPRTPPYVDAVRSTSPAAAVGLQTDDLIVFVGGQPTASCREVVAALQRYEKRDAVRISVLRAGELLEFELGQPRRAPREVDDDAAPPSGEDEAAAPRGALDPSTSPTPSGETDDAT